MQPEVSHRTHILILRTLGDHKKEEATGEEIMNMTGLPKEEVIQYVNKLLRKGYYTLEGVSPVNRLVESLDFRILVTKAGKDAYEEIKNYAT